MFVVFLFTSIHIGNSFFKNSFVWTFEVRIAKMCSSFCQPAWIFFSFCLYSDRTCPLCIHLNFFNSVYILGYAFEYLHNIVAILSCFSFSPSSFTIVWWGSCKMLINRTGLRVIYIALQSHLIFLFLIYFGMAPV